MQKYIELKFIILLLFNLLEPSCAFDKSSITQTSKKSLNSKRQTNENQSSNDSQDSLDDGNDNADDPNVSPTVGVILGDEGAKNNTGKNSPGAGNVRKNLADLELALEKFYPERRRLATREMQSIFDDVLGTKMKIENDIPRDIRVSGFDTHAQTLNTELFFSTKYLGLVNKIADGYVKSVGEKCNDESCLVSFVREKLPRLWRRNIGPEESEGIVKWLQSHRKKYKLSIKEGLSDLATRVLLSPNFMFTQKTANPNGDDCHATAERLALNLWGTAPDAKLIQLAQPCRLKSQEDLNKQTERMTSDPRFDHYLRNFILNFSGVTEGFDQVDSKQIGVSESLKNDMIEQTVNYFIYIYKNDLPAILLFENENNFLNAALSSHYNISSGISSKQMEMVKISDPNYLNGILSHASVLTINSSIIGRGLFLAQRFMCQDLGDAATAIERAETTDDRLPDEGTVSARKMVELQTETPDCAACHAAINPLGYVMQNFDRLGKVVNKDRHGFNINTKTDWYGGEASSLSDIVKIDFGRKALVSCIAQRSLESSLGRLLDYSIEADREAIKIIMEGIDPNSMTLKEVIRLGWKF